MRTFSAGEVRKVTKLPNDTFYRWTTNWLTSEDSRSKGIGHHRRFTLMELFALYAGTVWRDEEAGSQRVADIIRFLSRVPQEKWELELEKGHTWPVLPYLFGELELPLGTGMFVNPPTGKGIDGMVKRTELGGIWKEVIQKVSKLKPVHRGRPEGSKNKPKRKKTLVR